MKVTQEQCERAVKALQEKGFEASHWEVFSAQKVTQEQCERAVKALQYAGHHASHTMGEPDDHGVWVEVWNNDLQECYEFRIHDEEINYWESQKPNT